MLSRRRLFQSSLAFRGSLSLAAALLLSLVAQASHAFCGFYVAGGESKLYNHKSQVALVRDGDHTALELTLIPMRSRRSTAHGDSSKYSTSRGAENASSCPTSVESATWIWPRFNTTGTGTTSANSRGSPS